MIRSVGAKFPVMKSPLLLFIVLLLSACGVVRVSQSSSQFNASNMGFEDGPGGVGMPSAWGYGNSSRTSYEWASDSEVKQSGEQALRIRSITGTPGGFGGVTQCVNTPDRVSSLRYSGFLKTDQVSGAPEDGSASGAGLWIRVANEPDTDEVSFDNMYQRHEPGVAQFIDDRRLHGTSDWTRQTTQLAIPAERGRTCFGVLMSSSGTMWADDLKLEYSPSS